MVRDFEFAAEGAKRAGTIGRLIDLKIKLLVEYWIVSDDTLRNAIDNFYVATRKETPEPLISIRTFV